MDMDDLTEAYRQDRGRASQGEALHCVFARWTCVNMQALLSAGGVKTFFDTLTADEQDALSAVLTQQSPTNSRVDWPTM